MEPLRELLASDHRQTLEFFYVSLQEVVDPTVDRHELFYNASVLAHHAQVSSHAVSELPTPATLATPATTARVQRKPTKRLPPAPLVQPFCDALLPLHAANKSRTTAVLESIFRESRRIGVEPIVHLARPAIPDIVGLRRQ